MAPALPLPPATHRFISVHWAGARHHGCRHVRDSPPVRLPGSASQRLPSVTSLRCCEHKPPTYASARRACDRLRPLAPPDNQPAGTPCDTSATTPPATQVSHGKVAQWVQIQDTVPCSQSSHAKVRGELCTRAPLSGRPEPYGIRRHPAMPARSATSSTRWAVFCLPGCPCL